MLAVCSTFHPTYYAKNYAGIMGAGLYMNRVMYEVEESLPATYKSDRTGKDLNSVLSILSAVDLSIQNALINDLYRLGRFDPKQS